MITILADYRMSSDEVLNVFSKYQKVVESKHKQNLCDSEIDNRLANIINKTNINSYVAFESAIGLMFVERSAIRIDYVSGVKVKRSYATRFMKWCIESKTITIFGIINKTNTRVSRLDDRSYDLQNGVITEILDDDILIPSSPFPMLSECENGGDNKSKTKKSGGLNSINENDFFDF